MLVVSVRAAEGIAGLVSLGGMRDLRGWRLARTRQVIEQEDTSRTGREESLTQLLRMASSIDWRIRRIESGENA